MSEQVAPVRNGQKAGRCSEALTCSSELFDNLFAHHVRSGVALILTQAINDQRLEFQAKVCNVFALHTSSHENLTPKLVAQAFSKCPLQAGVEMAVDIVSAQCSGK